MLPDVYTRLSSYIKETNVKGTFWNCPLPNEKKNLLSPQGGGISPVGVLFPKTRFLF